MAKKVQVTLTANEGKRLMQKRQAECLRYKIV